MTDWLINWLTDLSWFELDYMALIQQHRSSTKVHPRWGSVGPNNSVALLTQASVTISKNGKNDIYGNEDQENKPLSGKYCTVYGHFWKIGAYTCTFVLSRTIIATYIAVPVQAVALVVTAAAGGGGEEVVVPARYLRGQ